MKALPTESENPSGLYSRYIVTKANGEPCDPLAFYFVLRLDPYGDDPAHVEACRAAARTWCEKAPPHLGQVVWELRNILDEMMPMPSGGAS